jgi:hypothetical protein
MAAFNTWVNGSFLESPENRKAGQIGRNLLEGACQILRSQQLRTSGVAIPQEAFIVPPKLWADA